MPIIHRHETLTITKQEMLQRLGRLEEEVEGGQRQLQTMEQEHTIKKLVRLTLRDIHGSLYSTDSAWTIFSWVSQMANRKLSELQSELEMLEEKNKQAEVNLHMVQGLSREKVCPQDCELRSFTRSVWLKYCDMCIFSKIEEVGRLLMAINNLAEQCHLPAYGPLENMSVLTMMDMVKVISSGIIQFLLLAY